MLTLRDVMTEDIVAVSPETSLRDAIETLQAEEVGGMPVVAGERVVGVVSATDLLAFEATRPGVPTERPTQVEWGGLEEAEPWEEGEAPPAAFFSDYWDDAGADVLERIEEDRGPEWDPLEEHVVGEVMTRLVCAMGPDEGLPEAAAFMLEAGIHRVLVMDEGRLLGIVTMTDIVRAVAERRL